MVIEHDPIIDPGPIKKAIEACSNAGLVELVESIAERASIDDVNELACEITALIQRGDIDDIGDLLNDPIEDTLKDQQCNWEQLQKLESLIGQIAVSCALYKVERRVSTSDCINVSGVNMDWAIRLLIDAALGRSLTHVCVTDMEPKVHAGYAEALEASESPTATMQAHQLIEQISADCVSKGDSIFPMTSAPDYDNQLKEFCVKYNAMHLRQRNTSRDHRFVYTHGSFPKEARERLQELGLCHLRIVEVDLQSHKKSSLRIGEDNLVGWLASNLDRIREAANELANQNTNESTGITIYCQTINSVGDHNTAIQTNCK